jgi:hypothetical protein
MRTPKVDSISHNGCLDSLASKTTHIRNSFIKATGIRRNGEESKMIPDIRIVVNLDLGDPISILKFGIIVISDFSRVAEESGLVDCKEER